MLRKRLEFQAEVFSADHSIEASACAGDYRQRACVSLEAGCDMILVCNAREPAASVADAVIDYINPVTHSRLVRMHGRACTGLAVLQSAPRWEQAVAAVRGYEELPELDLEG